MDVQNVSRGKTKLMVQLYVGCLQAISLKWYNKTKVVQDNKKMNKIFSEIFSLSKNDVVKAILMAFLTKRLDHNLNPEPLLLLNWKLK